MSSSDHERRSFSVVSFDYKKTPNAWVEVARRSVLVRCQKGIHIFLTPEVIASRRRPHEESARAWMLLTLQAAMIATHADLSPSREEPTRQRRRADQACIVPAHSHNGSALWILRFCRPDRLSWNMPSADLLAGVGKREASDEIQTDVQSRRRWGT